MKVAEIVVKILEDEGKVTSQAESRGKRTSKTFSITPAGKKEFSDWIAAPAVDESRRNELLLKLFFGASVPQKIIIKQLELKQKRVKETLQRFNDIEKNVVSQVSDQYEHKRFWTMTLRNGILHAKAELKWLAECIRLLENNT